MASSDAGCVLVFGRGVVRRVEVAGRGCWIGGFVFANFVFAGGRAGGRGGRRVAEPLELEEITEGAGIGAAEARLHAMEETKGGAVGERLESSGEGLNGSEWVVRVLLFTLDGCGEELGFDEGDALETPLGRGHFVDQVELGRAIRLELLGIGGEESVVFVGVQI